MNSCLKYVRGHARAPDAPWGLEELELASDGSYAYTQRVGDVTVGVGQGHVDASRATGIFDALRRSAFPDVPHHSVPPGASVVTLELGATDAASLDYFFGLGLEGYREALPALDALLAEVRRCAVRDGSDRSCDADVRG